MEESVLTKRNIEDTIEELLVLKSSADVKKNAIQVLIDEQEIMNEELSMLNARIFSLSVQVGEHANKLPIEEGLGMLNRIKGLHG